MTRDEWRRTEPLLTQAVILPDPDREALLATLDVEEAVRRDLQELLRRGFARSSVAVTSSVSPLPAPPGGPARSGSPLPGAAPAVPGSAALAPGATLASGRYVVVRQIGRGGMGAVFLGHDTTFATLVALKVMPYDERVLAEARRAAVCSDHPHVVTVHNVLREQVGDVEVGVLVMELRRRDAGEPAARGRPDRRPPRAEVGP